MKKVLLALLMIIPLLIVAAVLLVTEMVLLTPTISVESVQIVDEYQMEVTDINVENFYDGKWYQLYAKVSPKKADNKDVIWSIDLDNATMFNADFDGDIAEVSSDGLVTIHSTGIFDVVCKTVDGGYQARCTFSVKSEVATSAYVVYNAHNSTDIDHKLTMNTDQIIKLDACARPTDVDIDYVAWSSSDTNILTVDSNGIITPKRTGKANVTVRLKSQDNNRDNDIYPAELTDTVEVTVTADVFKVPFYNVCTDEDTATVALSDLAYDTGGITLKSADAAIISTDGSSLEFTSGVGTAVLQKGGKTITVNKYRSGKYLIENADILNNRTLIIGKIPVNINVINVCSGQYAENVEYVITSETDNMVRIDNGGRITALREGAGDSRLGVVVKVNGEMVGALEFTVREAVVYFSLKTDTYGGIARERIYGNHWYTTDSADSLTSTREPLTITRPVELSNDRFIWHIDNNDIASINELGAITIADFDGERKITVTATARDSAYASDRVAKKYVFIARTGINVTSSAQIKAAAEAKAYDIYMQKDITFVSVSQECQLYLYKNMFGNGHMLNWEYATNDEKKNVEGSHILQICGDNLLLRNVRIQSSQLPSDGTFTSKDFSKICVEARGYNTTVQYCQIENAQNCVYSVCNKLTVDGCVLGNTTRASLFTWIDSGEEYLISRNNIFGPCIIPSIGLSNGTDNEADTCTFTIEGFLRIYNWKQSLDTDMLGDIVGSDVPNYQLVNKVLKELINQEINKSKYDPYCYTVNGIRYMHEGMMVAGFMHERRCEITGTLEENGFNMLVFSIKDYGQQLGLDNLKDIYLYGYSDHGAVGPTDPFPALDDATCAELRGENV